MTTAEAAALLDVERREVESVDVQHAGVDDHHLAVIADKVVGGARDGDAPLEQLQFQAAEALVAAAVGVGRERSHVDPARHSGLQRAGKVGTIQAEDENIDALSRLLDRRDNRGNSSVRLNDQLHR